MLTLSQASQQILERKGATLVRELDRLKRERKKQVTSIRLRVANSSKNFECS